MRRREFVGLVGATAAWPLAAQAQPRSKGALIGFLVASAKAVGARLPRLPTVFNFREHVEDGGLISYGIDLRENYRRAAYYVNRILKGQPICRSSSRPRSSSFSRRSEAEPRQGLSSVPL
jgi:hypothetical protein